MTRSRSVLLLAIAMVLASCGDDAPAESSAPATTAAETTTTAIITTTTTTTTTSTTTTIPIEQQDAALGADLWLGLTGAWEEGPEAAARFIADHTYPGWPASFANCLRPDLAAGWATYKPNPSTVEETPGWTAIRDLEVDGRIYKMSVDVTTGGPAGVYLLDSPNDTRTPHFTVVDDQAFFFIRCTAPVPDDALAYRLAEGEAYHHEVTFRAAITEDQSPAGGHNRTGRETWTVDRLFEVTSAGENEARLSMVVDRVIWDVATRVGNHTYGGSFDSNRILNENELIGPLGDLVGDTARVTVDRDGARAIAIHGFSFIDLPVSVVAEGDAWESDWALDGPALNGDMTVTVLSIDEETVTVSLEGSGSGAKTYLEFPSARYRLITEGTLTGTAVIDRATGWVVSVEVDIVAEGTVEFASQGFWNPALRPLGSSDEIAVGVEMPCTYEIHVEVATVED